MQANNAMKINGWSRKAKAQTFFWGFAVKARAGRVAMVVAGLAAGALALSPAISAVRLALAPLGTSKVSLKALGSIGSFTPVTTDERLARAYAQAATNSRSHGFKFTPTSGLASGERSITVVVRAPSGVKLPSQPVANLGLAPVSYNLGVARGLQRFTAPDTVGTRELDPVVTDLSAPETRSFSVEHKPRRFTTNMQVASKALTGSAPQTLAGERSYAVDVASSYALTRNLDVRAGVRYTGPSNRLVPITDDAQDSQAVYVGTAFKF